LKPNTRPPRDDLFRALYPGPTFKRAQGDAPAQPVLEGHFVVFNEWTEINSMFEGRFMEQFAPGSAKKTLRERGDQIRCLFQHGYDPYVGDKPLGPFSDLSEDETGVYYAVPLLDTRYNSELIPGLEAGVYGASFRFRVLREEIVEEPGVSDHNPNGLPERTVKEFALFEGGPVTFPAYATATAGLRSVTDEFALERLARQPDRLREMVEAREDHVSPVSPEPVPSSEEEPVGLADPAEVDVEGEDEDEPTDLPEPVEGDEETAPPESDEDDGSRPPEPDEASATPTTPHRDLYLGTPEPGEPWQL
jgi:HK97 family phage prohead protease